MTPEIRLSVALVTRNRPESLRRCLASLRAQDPQPWEIVISDDSLDAFVEETQAVAKEFRARYVPGPRRGLYANRNAVARACRGTHVRSMDDDHTFPSGHFAQCLAAVQSRPEALWTTGEQSDINGEFFAFQPRANQLHPSGVGCPVSQPNDNWAIADGATVFPRTVFTEGRGFVEEFGFGSAYLEFGALLYSMGWRSCCIPDAYVEHHAEAATVVRSAAPSRLFASICYNLHF